MTKAISYKRHQFPGEVIQQAVWLYFRFTLSFRDVEELLVQRGIEVSDQTVRCWTIKFGPQIAKNLNRRKLHRHRRAGASTRWSPRSPASACICGVRSMMRASSFTS